MSGMEIERKFLVRKGSAYRSAAFSFSHIQQGYIKAEGATVRVRVRDDKAYLTIKSKSVDGGLSRYEFEKEIIAYVKRKYNVLIGDRTAEEIKIAIASAAPYEGEEPYSVMGRNLVDGFPKEVTLTPAEIREVLSEQIGVIIDAILTTLERTPPELSADILETGITLAGGGAMLHGMDKLVAQQTGMPVFIAEEPLDCVARGTGAILESPETFSRTLFFDNRPSR